VFAAVSSEYAKLLDSGAMQITLSKLSIDYYPFHPAGMYFYFDNIFIIKARACFKVRNRLPVLI
jgi:hypothetical protein